MKNNQKPIELTKLLATLEKLRPSNKYIIEKGRSGWNLWFPKIGDYSRMGLQFKTLKTLMKYSNERRKTLGRPILNWVKISPWYYEAEN